VTAVLTAGHVDIVLVRHAQAGSKGQFPGEDSLRPLSRRGRNQAARIADALAPLRPSRIISSPLLRCIETVEPLAERMAIPVETDPELAPSAASHAASTIVQLLAQLGSRPCPLGPWVVCTHGENLGTMIPAITAGALLPQKPPGAKGGIWTIDARGSEPVVGYVPRP